MRYLVHDPSGRILHSGACAAADLALLAGPGETALGLPDDHHPIDDRRHRVEGGRVVVGEIAPAELLLHLRLARNRRLAASDWTQLPDAPLSPAGHAAWATYRQALRDLPATAPHPAQPSWPQAPRIK